MVSVDTDDDEALKYFLKNSESSSIMISSFTAFLRVGTGITYEYGLLISIFSTESLH